MHYLWFLCVLNPFLTFTLKVTLLRVSEPVDLSFLKEIIAGRSGGSD